MSKPRPLHTPVLLNEVLAMASEMSPAPRWAMDATFGRGGHAKAFLQNFSELKMIGLDRDEQAISYGNETYKSEINSGRLHLMQGNFHRMSELLPQALKITGGERFDLILADLGVSSPQLDQADRGFSFYNDGPLDMRMDQSQSLSAADIINTWTEGELTALFRESGEINRPGRVVERVIEARRIHRLTTTRELATIIEKAEGWQRKGHHPATRYFLALRLEVNDELSGLKPSLDGLAESLAPGGRLMIITFHSLEDRIIKYALRERSDGRLVNKKVIAPSRAECVSNPRARSAKLRGFEKGVSL